MPQSLASVLVHLIYSTKNRYPFLTPAIDPELYAFQASIFQEVGSPAFIINGTEDHVHALFRLSRTMALCDVVEEVKKRSSKWLKTKGTALAGFNGKPDTGPFLWANRMSKRRESTFSSKKSIIEIGRIKMSSVNSSSAIRSTMTSNMCGIDSRILAFAPKGQRYSSPGQRPGWRRPGHTSVPFPRALPWAAITRPVGA